MVYLYSEILLRQKSEIMPLSETWMDLEIIILSEVSKTEKGTYCMWNLKNDANVLIYKIEQTCRQKTNIWSPKVNKVGRIN